jgi:hypothetical protein
VPQPPTLPHAHSGLKPRAILLVKASRKLLLLCMELKKQGLQLYTIQIKLERIKTTLAKLLENE